MANTTTLAARKTEAGRIVNELASKFDWDSLHIRAFSDVEALPNYAINLDCKAGRVLLVCSNGTVVGWDGAHAEKHVGVRFLGSESWQMVAVGRHFETDDIRDIVVSTCLANGGAVAMVTYTRMVNKPYGAAMVYGAVAQELGL